MRYNEPREKRGARRSVASSGNTYYMVAPFRGKMSRKFRGCGKIFSPPLASAANLQARTPPPAANGAAPPDPDDAWMRNVLGPDYDAPWPGYADMPSERRHAA